MLRSTPDRSPNADAGVIERNRTTNLYHGGASSAIWVPSNDTKQSATGSELRLSFIDKTAKIKYLRSSILTNNPVRFRVLPSNVQVDLNSLHLRVELDSCSNELESGSIRKKRRMTHD